MLKIQESQAWTTVVGVVDHPEMIKQNAVKTRRIMNFLVIDTSTLTQGRGFSSALIVAVILPNEGKSVALAPCSEPLRFQCYTLPVVCSILSDTRRVSAMLLDLGLNMYRNNIDL